MMKAVASMIDGISTPPVEAHAHTGHHAGHAIGIPGEIAEDGAGHHQLPAPIELPVADRAFVVRSGISHR
jgi:hypothetical protein